jgi:GNAT superfamily N-acetyltransferase
MSIIIRRAKAEDCPRILELIKELAEYERAPEEVTVNFEHFVESGFGNDPVWWAFVAEEEGRIHGFALYYIRYSTWKGQRLFLEDIIVTQDQRGRGIGKMLFDSIIKECRDRNLNGMAWQVLDWNEPAINFYNKYPNVRISKEWLNFSLDNSYE